MRAKARIKEAGIPFAIPERGGLAERLDAVLEAIYAAYAKGWTEIGDTAADRLADEAIWLGRLVVSLLPDEPEAKGMLALMLYAEARRHARRDASGAYVPLEQQDIALWDEPTDTGGRGAVARRQPQRPDRALSDRGRHPIGACRSQGQRQAELALGGCTL